MRHAVFAALFLLVPGCMGDEGGPPPVDTSQLGVRDEGCDGNCPDLDDRPPDIANTTSPGAAAPVGAEAVTITTFAFEGQTPGAVCAPAEATLSHCKTLVPGRNKQPEAPAGRAMRVVANITWATSTPAEDMAAYLEIETSEGWTWSESDPIVVGKSPLVVDWGLAGYPEGTRLRLTVDSGLTAQAPGGVGIEAPHEFSVEGAWYTIASGA